MVRAAAERPAGLLPRLLRDGAEPGWFVHRLDELSSSAAALLRCCSCEVAATTTTTTNVLSRLLNAAV